MITTGSAIPASQASYYTKSEVDALFVEDATSGAAGSVDAANRKLKDSGGTDSIDWQNRKLYDGSTEYIRWDNGLGFFNTAAVAKPTGSNLINSVSSLGLLSYTAPTNANVISNLISAGIFASSQTYGVLPLSIYTLVTTASLNFGTIGGGDSVEKTVTITGARPYDIVNWGVPTGVATGLIFDARVSANDTVALRAFNVDNQSHTAATDTYRLLVIGY